MSTTRQNEQVSVTERWKIVKWVVFEGASIQEVADRIERSRPVIYKYVNLYLETGDVSTEYERQRDEGLRIDTRKKIMGDNPFAITYLTHTMIGKSDTTLKEYRSQLLKYGIRASVSTIHRYFVNNNITTKVTTKVCSIEIDITSMLYPIYQTLYVYLIGCKRG